MDVVRERVKEQKQSRNRKLAVGIIAVIIVIIVATMLELRINKKLSDVVIMKNEITDEKATFIPLKKLGTNIIAVKAADGTYRLAFDDCIGCYYTDGKHYSYENNSDNTGLVCKNCKAEVTYDDMGFLTEESMPYPIAESEIISESDRFIISAQYLENKKQILENMRSGKIENEYSER